MLIDGGFTLSSGRLLVDRIKASGKRLTTIFVTCDDPDYYFGLGPVVAAFPQAQVLATPGTAQMIRDTGAHKIDVWKPRIGNECPQRVADVAIPQPHTDLRLTLEGVSIEVQTARPEEPLPLMDRLATNHPGWYTSGQRYSCLDGGCAAITMKRIYPAGAST